MKRQLAFLTICLLTLGRGVANADLLSNGNLDATGVSGQVLPTPLGWVATASKAVSGPFNDGMSSEGFANVFAPGGNGLFFKPFQGTTADKLTASLYQDNPAIPGLTYTLTGWAGAEANYIGLTDATVKSEFHLQFLNGANTVIGDSILNLVANGQHVLGASNGNAFGYFNYTLSATAPAGTVSVRALATMVGAYANPAGGGQAFVVDAFTLVPEPSTISLAVLGLAGMLAYRRRK
jgi:PEP-CTERM motif